MNSILVGIVAGIIRTIFGWAKSNESFDALKFLRTLIISTITGGIVGIYIQDVREVFAITFTGTILIEEFLIGLYKRV